MEFIAKGRLTLEGVTFYIQAVSLRAAILKAGDGTFDRYEIDSAEMVVDANIKPSTVQENV